MNDVVLKIENIVTSNAPPFDQPWPPALMDGWVLVRAIGENETLWRRISIADTATIKAEGRGR
jgi:hypothetical protein